MPKVSAQHIASMQEQILQAAMACFAENGFHATGMAEIIKASGSSAGGVYRYYKSKDELIIAIIQRHLSHLNAQVMTLDKVDTPLALLERCLTSVDNIRTNADYAVFAKVLPQVWTETLRNQTIADLVNANYQIILRQFEQYLSTMQMAGNLPTGVDVKVLAQIIWSLVQGYSLQSLLFESIDKSQYLTTLEQLSL